MTIQSNHDQLCAFWLARVGSCAGKPLRKPYTSTNSFAVQSDDADSDFAGLMCLYLSGAYRYYANGTCQPFLHIADARMLVKGVQDYDAALLEKLRRTIELQAELKVEAERVRELIQHLAYAITEKEVKSNEDTKRAGYFKRPCDF